MNPKVLSIYNNAKIFLSTEEMRELQLYIDRDLGKKQPVEPFNVSNVPTVDEYVTIALNELNRRKK